MRVTGRLIFYSIMKKSVVPVENTTVLGLRFFLLGSTLGLVHLDSMEELQHCDLLACPALAMLLAVLLRVEEVKSAIFIDSDFHD